MYKFQFCIPCLKKLYNQTHDSEHTTFYYEIQRRHLQTSLDMFAQFFIKPLMKKEAMEREREYDNN